MPDQPNQPKVLYEIPESEPLAPQFDMYMLGIQYLDNKIAGSGISWGNFDDMMKNGAAATVVAGTEPLDITSLPGQIEFTVTSGGVSKVAVIGKSNVDKPCIAACTAIRSFLRSASMYLVNAHYYCISQTLRKTAMQDERKPENKCTGPGPIKQSRQKHITQYQDILHLS